MFLQMALFHFFFIAELYSIVYIVSSSIHDGHLPSPQILGNFSWLTLIKILKYLLYSAVLKEETISTLTYGLKYLKRMPNQF